MTRPEIEQLVSEVLRREIRLVVSDPQSDETWVCRVKEGNIEHCAALIAAQIAPEE